MYIYIYKEWKEEKRRNHQSWFLAERIGLRVSQILGRTWFDRAFETFQCYIGFVGDIRAYTNSANTPTYRGEQPATLAMLVEVKYLSTCRNVRGSTSYVGGGEMYGRYRPWNARNSLGLEHAPFQKEKRKQRNSLYGCELILEWKRNRVPVLMINKEIFWGILQSLAFSY